ncbi:DUF5695 domain-containing protein [Mariniflexile soesokkakense]|uniref:DUF5695 domain-containing protein n=1 Tax=Mariniflexile soesokkakense TaxID=1343160 RepID=A0ABV0ADS9_9FLAO
MSFKYKHIIYALFFIGICKSINSQNNKTQTLKDDNITVELNHDGITKIISPHDSHQANIVSAGSVWGHAQVQYQIAPKSWLSIYTDETTVSQNDNNIIYTDFIKGMPIKMVRSFAVNNGGIDWNINIQNMSKFPLTIGDLAIPLPWNKPSSENPEYVFEKGFVEHQHIAENGSFIYFTRPSGEAPYLMVMTKPGTILEYFNEAGNKYKVFIHSSLSASEEKQGSWRLDNTSLKLNPSGTNGDNAEYGFRIEWANSYEEMRDILYKNNLFDTRIVPGMSIPQDLTAKIALRSKNTIDSIVAEYPKLTELKILKSNKEDTKIYEVSFKKLGENMLTIYYNGNEKTVLEFFSTEPIETLIKKRSKFIVEKQQHTDSTKWYNGLYSIWDMDAKQLRGPDNTDGFDNWWGYVLASDDPALCKAPFLAAKNVFTPDDKEIASLEYYLENYVWGGLQLTNQDEKYPYGIYGVPNWKVNKDELLKTGISNRNLDKEHIWRSYDYPHLFMLYYHMYEIAKFYPEKVSYLDAEGYLERAFQTAKVYFIYPYEILPWYDTYKWGCYNELVLLPIIKTLEDYGRHDDADFLRNEWEKKVKYFVYDDKYPFRSEYSFDRTAFESSYAFAKYGATTDMKPDSKLWYDVKLDKWYSHPEVKKEDSKLFMERQHLAGLAVRGWLNNAYYFYGSDDTLSYMARMGGWSILDYALNFSETPWDWLQLGYASYLSSYALVNSGIENSSYGYWYSGKENDGAMGWAFNPQKNGKIWLQGRMNPRGSWNYDGEADLGNGAIFRTAATILAEDPIFGWFTYGGTHTLKNNTFSILPKDGVLNTFWVISNKQKIGVTLNRDGLKKDSPITYSTKKNEIILTIENKANGSHTTEMTLLSKNKWQVFIDGKELNPEGNKNEDEKTYMLPINNKQHIISIKL